MIFSTSSQLSSEPTSCCCYRGGQKQRRKLNTEIASKWPKIENISKSVWRHGIIIRGILWLIHIVCMSTSNWWYSPWQRRRLRWRQWRIWNAKALSTLARMSAFWSKIWVVFKISKARKWLKNIVTKQEVRLDGTSRGPNKIHRLPQAIISKCYIILNNLYSCYY